MFRCGNIASSGYLTDTGNHPPPTSGTQNYNAFTPPALGASYTDSVFGASVRRLTDIGANTSQSQQYSYHNVNADGTLAFSYVAGQMDIINVSDGSVAYSAQPTGSVSQAEIRWHMTDADKYYYWSTASLVRRNLAAQTNTTIKTFAANLEALGGTANYSDRTNRYFLVAYSGTCKLWDSQTDTIYTNTVTPLNWVGLSPSGNTIVTQAGAGVHPNIVHSAYAVNHGTTTIAASPVQYWGFGGDHAALISPSDGNEYALVFDNDTAGYIYLANLATDNSGKTAAQQIASATLTIPAGFFISGGHFSAVSVGANKDWCFYSSEAGTGHPSGNDDFNQAVGAWQAFKQEIVAVNVLTGALRRFAHHRSRGDYSGYFDQPRVSCSPTGNVVMWSSNMNDSTPAAYSDYYAIVNPLA